MLGLYDGIAPSLPVSCAILLIIEDLNAQMAERNRLAEQRSGSKMEQSKGRLISSDNVTIVIEDQDREGQVSQRKEQGRLVFLMG